MFSPRRWFPRYRATLLVLLLMLGLFAGIYVQQSEYPLGYRVYGEGAAYAVRATHLAGGLVLMLALAAASEWLLSRLETPGQPRLHLQTTLVLVLCLAVILAANVKGGQARYVVGERPAHPEDKTLVEAQPVSARLSIYGWPLAANSYQAVGAQARPGPAEAVRRYPMVLCWDCALLAGDICLGLLLLLMVGAVSEWWLTRRELQQRTLEAQTALTRPRTSRLLRRASTLLGPRMTESVEQERERRRQEKHSEEFIVKKRRASSMNGVDR